MRKMIRTFSVFLIIIAMLFMFGCSSAGSDKITGTWHCVEAEMNGEKLDVSEAFSDDPTLQFKTFGRAELAINGEVLSYRYFFDGENITIRSGHNTYTAVFDGDMISFESILGIKMIFVKSVEIKNEEKGDLSETGTNLCGEWVTVGVDTGNGKIKGSVLGFDVEGLLTLKLYEDGTAITSAMGKDYQGTWTPESDTSGTVSGNGMTLSYRVSDDGMLVFRYNDMDVYLKRTKEYESSEEAPDISEVPDSEEEPSEVPDSDPDIKIEIDTSDIFGKAEEIIDFAKDWFDANKTRMGV